MQKRQRAGDIEVAPRSIALQVCGVTKNNIARAAAMATKKGRRTKPGRSSFSRPGRIDLSSRGAAEQITLTAKSSLTAVHSR
jgi:hypothetical protein